MNANIADSDSDRSDIFTWNWIALVGVSGPRTGSLGSPHLARSIRPARPQSNAFTTTTNLKLLQQIWKKMIFITSAQ